MITLMTLLLPADGIRPRLLSLSPTTPLTGGNAVLSAGEEGNYAGADSLTATLTIGGKPSEAVTTDGVKIGTIKVTIS